MMEILTNVTTLTEIPDTGLIPIEYWVLLPIAGFIMLTLSSLVKRDEMVFAICSFFLFAIAAYTAFGIEMYSISVLPVYENYSSYENLSFAVIPVSRHIMLPWLIMFNVMMAIIALMQSYKRIFDYLYDEAADAESREGGGW